MYDKESDRLTSEVPELLSYCSRRFEACHLASLAGKITIEKVVFFPRVILIPESLALFPKPEFRPRRHGA
jgi:hypothetical protein